MAQADVIDCELVCKCGIQFRCPRCGQAPCLRLVSTGLVDGNGAVQAVELFERPTSTPQRADPVDDPEHWALAAEGAVILQLSEDSFRRLSGDLSKLVRRKRVSHSFHWYRPDLLQLAKIREQCALGLDGSLRTYAAMLEGRI
jgi:hypothetical protein